MKKIIFVSGIFYILSIGSSSVLSAAVVTEYLPINTDTLVNINMSGNPGIESINYGENDRLYVAGEQWTSWGAGRTLISFDASLIPSEAKNIRLKLYAYSGDTRSGYDSRIELYRVTNAWGEMTATWNNKPSFDNTQVYDQVIINHNMISGWHEWDITKLVNEWKKGLYNNNGLMLYNSPNYSGGGYRNFYSSENIDHASLVPVIAYDINSEKIIDSEKYIGSKTYSNGSSYDISIDLENKKYCVFVGGEEGCSELYVTENNSSNIKFHTSPYFNPTCKHSFDGKYSDGLISGNFYNPNCADTSSGSWSVKVLKNNIIPDNSSELKSPPRVYVNTNSQNIYKNEILQVYFNTLVFSNDSEKYDVYLSVSWDENVVFDNGTDLVTNKVPLFKNIEVPTFTSWFEYERLRYNFPENTPQTNYIVGLHLIDSEGNAVFEDFSSVSYYPKISPFSIDEAKKIRLKAKVKEVRSSKKTCILGGAMQVDTETQKHVYLALQMGSDLVINKLYPAINGSDSLVKGAFNLVKSGDKVCQHMNDLGNLYHSYDNNITNGLTDDQATSLFAIEFMASILKGVDDLGIYSWLEIEDLINGLKDVINLSKGIDKFYSEYINPDLSITLNEPFFNWNNIFSLSVPVDITLTTVFEYKVDGIALDKFSLKTAEKIFTNKDNIEIFTKKLGTVNSDGGKIKIDSLGLKMGLYIITASTTDGKEVYRDTVHLVTTKQKHTMTINRY